VFNLVVVVLKYAVVALLYLFLAYVLVTLSRDVVRAGRRETGAPRAAKLAVVGGPGAAPGQTFPLSDAALIGRGDGVDVLLSDDFASERHARVTRSGQGFVLEDLGSTNGTYLGEHRLSEAVTLFDGDEFTVGQTTLRYRVVA